MPHQFSTLTSLLSSRAVEPEAGLHFLDSEGYVAKELSYAELYQVAQDDSRRLLRLLSETKPSSNVVIASLSNHELHVKLFWACCFAGIPVCPIPALHPDPSRQASFLAHLQNLFQHPVMITDDLKTMQAVSKVAPRLKAISWATYQSQAISPSDIVCLMLTSGSTGNPKAVALRHSNLLSSVYGKIAHHSTSSSSRFLNWIAFDHVACVSEIHIHALAVNASQYHVSPSAVLQRPLRLLGWCSRYRIGYTFSPNFLIAQICRDLDSNPLPSHALDLSPLAAFISGGEAVPMRTAVAFADILERFGAPRNVLRAGFGMSETGAGCIYDTRPCPRDEKSSAERYLGLGLCCEGISMRIVSRETGQVCLPLEPGDLQLKGPTVFSEYYNDPKATSESFTADGWFVTGDRAMLDRDGNLHLVGREKDQININGVKYSSVDVEHFLEDGDINGLTRSHVFVCPMRAANSDTETYAVFYYHANVSVEAELSDEAVRLINETNRAIRDRCIVYCSQSPRVILPLPLKSFAKTALGKVSRSSLMTSYQKGEHRALEARLKSPSLPFRSAEGSLNAHEEKVARVVSDLLGVDAGALSRSTNLFDLGMSSMHIVQLKHHLQQAFGTKDIPIIDLLRRPELGQLSDYLTDLVSPRPPTQAAYNPLVCLKSHGSKPPVFFVHPGVGEVLVFMGLAKALDGDRPLYAIRARGLEEGEDVFASFDEMVSTYVAAIERTFPEGPYYLGGYSFGGAVAFEMAKVLEAKGRRVAWVGIMNLPPYIQSRMLELTWVEVLLNLFMFVALITPHTVDETRALLHSAFPESATSDMEPENSEQIIEWLLSRSYQARLQELRLKRDALRRWVHVAYQLTRLGRTYEPSGTLVQASLTVFCATPLPSMGTREVYKAKQLSSWKRFSLKDVEFVDVDGEHYTMLSEANVESFASKLASAIEPFGPPKWDFGEIPIIDFSLATTDPAKYFDQLRYALEDVGFVMFVNIPGFEDAFQQELFTLAHRLFSKPREWKESLGASKSYALRGYFRGDDVAGPHKAHAEAYRFGLHLPAPVGDDVPFWLKLHEGPNQWPAEEDLPRFRELMETLFDRYHALNLTLNQHICKLLDIPQAVLDAYYPEKPEFNCALWHYLPVTPEILASARNGFAQGMHEHRDPSTFVTCLIQSREGLQVQNHAGAWINVPYIKGGVVCNIGMQLMKLTGGKLVATTHRVNTLLITEDRYTIPYVLSTKLDKAIEPLPQFADGRMAKEHVAPNPKILKLMNIADPLERSGYARLSLFPSIAQKLYPAEFQRAHELGLL
ncbi:acetyl-CoA synthetase-like protein [Trametes punicea]|nr:acetyl-CoA synthetase-like protein [Trametes punicea]